MKKLCVLGITGSIGKNVSEVVKVHRDDFVIIGCAFNSNIVAFEEILKDNLFLKYVAIKDEKVALQVKLSHPELEVFIGEEGIISLIDADEYDMVVNSLVGFAGLRPTIHTLEKGIDCALANKESLVVGGELINRILKTSGAKLYPIDSEHVALSKLLKNRPSKEIAYLHITASGGSFRNYTREELVNVSVQDALKHPSWNMGAKITIDSATMMNKGFEIIEAYYLFNVELDRIKVLMHDESVIHSALELVDHSFIADLGPADMRIPITYALYEGNYEDTKNVEYLDFAKLGSLHFREFNEERYPAVKLARRALEIGESMPCVLNAANEIANEAFRNEEIPFLAIETIIENVMKMHTLVLNPSLEDLVAVDTWARKASREIIMKGEY